MKSIHHRMVARQWLGHLVVAMMGILPVLFTLADHYDIELFPDAPPGKP